MDNGYCEEEMKMVNETAKILGDRSVGVNATCIRVPVLRTHAEALNVEFSSTKRLKSVRAASPTLRWRHRL